MLDESAWLAICFGIFIAVSYKPIKAAIFSFLDGKILQIRHELEVARRTKIDAEVALRELKEHLKTTEIKYQEMLKVAKKEIDNNFKAKIEELEKTLEFKKHTAVENIKQLEDKAFKDIQNKFFDQVYFIVSDYFSKSQSVDLDIALISKKDDIKKIK